MTPDPSSLELLGMLRFSIAAREQKKRHPNDRQAKISWITNSPNHRSGKQMIITTTNLIDHKPNNLTQVACKRGSFWSNSLLFEVAGLLYASKVTAYKRARECMWVCLNICVCLCVRVWMCVCVCVCVSRRVLASLSLFTTTICYNIRVSIVCKWRSFYE